MDRAAEEPQVSALRDTRRTGLFEHPDLRGHQPDPADGHRPQDLHRRAV